MVADRTQYIGHEIPFGSDGCLFRPDQTPFQCGSDAIQRGSDPIQRGSDAVQRGSNVIQRGSDAIQGGSNDVQSRSTVVQSTSNTRSERANHDNWLKTSSFAHSNLDSGLEPGQACDFAIQFSPQLDP